VYGVGQAFQPPGDGTEQLVAGRGDASPDAVEEAVRPGGMEFGFAHVRIPWPPQSPCGNQAPERTRT
jgi:hypothetical protein